MSKQRMVNTRFWNDNYISDLDPSEKLVFLYALTNSYTSICGVYEIPLKQIALDTGFEKELVEKILRRFEEDGKIIYRDGWLIIRNFTKHQALNPSVKRGIEVEMEKLPKAIKTLAFDSLSTASDSEVHLNLNLNSNLNLNIKENDATTSSATRFSEKDYELAGLLLGLIRKNTPTFKQPDLNKWADHVRLMRERDERTEEQIEFVINWCQKDNFWQANILSTKKLREKFDTLVAQIKRDVNKDQITKSNVAFS